MVTAGVPRNVAAGVPRNVTASANVTVGVEPWSASDGMRLRSEQRRELGERYGAALYEPGVAPSAEDIAIFVIARDAAGVALGCGALRLLEPGAAEVKRMYVVASHRGTGVASAILRDLENRARALGLGTLKLETGTLQPDAIRFYEREGYERIANFGAYRDEPASLCFGRTL